jgi:predicted nucleic acid-binding protein
MFEQAFKNIDEVLWKEAGCTIIAAERRAAGRPISQFDCQIAAIARARDAAVATRNTVDFERCGVDLIDPWQLGY